jgi:hypothetical protein
MSSSYIKQHIQKAEEILLSFLATTKLEDCKNPSIKDWILGWQANAEEYRYLNKGVHIYCIGIEQRASNPSIRPCYYFLVSRAPTKLQSHLFVVQGKQVGFCSLLAHFWLIVIVF